jgi:hypothetical protein
LLYRQAMIPRFSIRVNDSGTMNRLTEYGTSGKRRPGKHTTVTKSVVSCLAVASWTTHFINNER